MQLKDLVVIVTGASSGIGKETALALGRERANVVLAARRKEKLEEIAKRIEAEGGTALVVPTDVGEESQVQGLITAVLQRFGRIDVLINNAGAGLFAPLEETSPEQMEKIWRTNFLGAFYAIRGVLPILKKQKKGHIVTVSSMAGRRATAMNAAYCSTKFALAGLMESLRMELRGTGIRCTTVYPGATETEFLSAMDNPGKHPVRYHGPVATASDVATAIVKAVRKPSAQVVTQKFGRTWVAMNILWPELADWLVGHIVKR